MKIKYAKYICVSREVCKVYPFPAVIQRMHIIGLQAHYSALTKGTIVSMLLLLLNLSLVESDALRETQFR